MRLKIKVGNLKINSQNPKIPTNFVFLDKNGLFLVEKRQRGHQLYPVIQAKILFPVKKTGLSWDFVVLNRISPFINV
ncbi:hypothetical protein [Rossellomorea sp. GCM10028870]|uniref:hypothetical protein n=1 Tax=Rossellomorea sp. GCM10028870 TaxID=3273426 RepID=UPI002608E134|nr:hypothetical protein [uncultured Rossellomorea sp.]